LIILLKEALSFIKKNLKEHRVKEILEEKLIKETKKTLP